MRLESTTLVVRILQSMPSAQHSDFAVFLFFVFWEVKTST